MNCTKLTLFWTPAIKMLFTIQFWLVLWQLLPPREQHYAQENILSHIGVTVKAE